jgi:hypothetical protein
MLADPEENRNVTTRAKLRTTILTGCDYGYVLVKGTDDADEALPLAFEAAEAEWGPDVLYLLEPEKPRRWRNNPCHPNSCWDGGGHRTHTDPVVGDRGQRGSYVGVMFRVGR